MDDVSSEAESFNEDDMYGLDHAMAVVSEASDEGDESEISDMSENVSMYFTLVFLFIT
jgi:hypothetical protein